MPLRQAARVGDFIALSPICVQTSFASSVTSALSTLETGQFCSALPHQTALALRIMENSPVSNASAEHPR
jgi:hypothetical protein